MFDLESAMKARREGRSVPITSFSVEEAVQRGIFRFAPPLIERSPEPKMLYQEWRAFQWVFEDIPDPRTFPSLPRTPPAEDIRIFRRYIDAAEELAESAFLCGSDRVTFRWRAATETAGESREVESSFTSKEITRGFAVLLRQFDSENERASFKEVGSRLRALSQEMIDSHERRRVEQIDSWQRAQEQLRDAELQRAARKKMGIDHGNDRPPREYLDAYYYGDLIHWGNGREALAKLEQHVHPDWQRISFAEAARSLAYLYVGFSEVVRAATRTDG
jgi:hypothetical protein